MAFVIPDRVREFTTTSGTGMIYLGGAAAGFRSFSDGVGNGNSTFYAISVPGGTEWEVGIGTVGVGTLTRDSVVASSNGGALVNFSAGTKDVFATYAGAGAVAGVGNEIIAPAGARLPVANGGTGVATAEAEVSRLAAASNVGELLDDLTTADLAESPSNLYFTTARAKAAVQSDLDAGVRQATTTQRGQVELATNTETTTGTDTERATTPAGVNARVNQVEARSVIAGNGLTGGGALDASRTLTLGTPSSITGTSTNSVTATSHTHYVDDASTTARGVVELATAAEIQTGSDNTRAITPMGFRDAQVAGSFARTQGLINNTLVAVPWQISGTIYSRNVTTATNAIVVPITGLYLVQFQLQSTDAVYRLFADITLGANADNAGAFRTSSDMVWDFSAGYSKTDTAGASGIVNITSTTQAARSIYTNMFQLNGGGIVVNVTAKIRVVRLGPPV